MIRVTNWQEYKENWQDWAEALGMEVVHVVTSVLVFALLAFAALAAIFGYSLDVFPEDEDE